MKNSLEKIDLLEKFSLFDDYYNPRIIGELNGQYIKIGKLFGEFVWHHHENEDEMFMVIKGNLTIEFRDKIVNLFPNELFIVPRGVEHKPVANEEVWVMLFEPASTLNTGNVQSDFTKVELEKI